MSRDAFRTSRLAAVRRSMDDADRALDRDLKRGYGPALDSWRACRAQAEVALEPRLPREDEE